MFTQKQEELLANFADLSDNLFKLGVIRTDSFTGEIGEYIACTYYKLKKTDRVTQAVDGISTSGKRYQIKAKLINKNNFGYSSNDLEAHLFDYLLIVYFDDLYNPLKIIEVESKEIKNGSIKIANSTLHSFKQIEGHEIEITSDIKSAINDFAISYNSLQENGIVRSRKIVGDIGEFYACNRLNLEQTQNINEKGIDARHENGLTFEIRTRRVYESGRRTSETRRLNNLVGKTAEYLIVVTLDRAFKCSGMWLLPMKNLQNPKSANLSVVNSTYGTLNLVHSKISWLNTGKIFKNFNEIK